MFVSQTSISSISPAQLAPPCAGIGFIQLRVLEWVPLPHVTEQGDHDSQKLHPPSTVTV